MPSFTWLTFAQGRPDSCNQSNNTNSLTKLDGNKLSWRIIPSAETVSSIRNELKADELAAIQPIAGQVKYFSKQVIRAGQPSSRPGCRAGQSSSRQINRAGQSSSGPAVSRAGQFYSRLVSRAGQYYSRPVSRGSK